MPIESEVHIGSAPRIRLGIAVPKSSKSVILLVFRPNDTSRENITLFNIHRRISFDCICVRLVFGRLDAKRKPMQSNEIRRNWIASYGIQRNETETNESKRKLAKSNGIQRSRQQSNANRRHQIARNGIQWNETECNGIKRKLTKRNGIKSRPTKSNRVKRK